MTVDTEDPEPSDELRKAAELEDWDRIAEEVNAKPRQPGKRAIRMGGPTERYTVEVTCPHCGWHTKARGLNFGPLPNGVTNERMVLHQHYGSGCPYWKNRLWRWWQRHGTPKYRYMYKRYKWRKWRERDLADQKWGPQDRGS